jgi:hypothetical protein
MTELERLLENVGHTNGRTSPIYAFCAEVARMLSAARAQSPTAWPAPKKPKTARVPATRKAPAGKSAVDDALADL